MSDLLGYRLIRAVPPEEGEIVLCVGCTNQRARGPVSIIGDIERGEVIVRTPGGGMVLVGIFDDDGGAYCADCGGNLDGR